jgi:adenylate cyclase
MLSLSVSMGTTNEANVSNVAAIREIVQQLAHTGVLETDSEDERVRKTTLTMSVMIIIPLATLWTVTYIVLGEWLIAIFPASYQVLALASLLLFFHNKRYLLFCFTQLSLILLLPIGMHVSFGGFVASSGVLLWSFLAPLGALLCRGPRYALPWFLGFVTAIAFAALFDPVLAERAVTLPEQIHLLFLALNLIAVTLTAFLILQYFVQVRDRAREALIAEQHRSDQLLLNVLPAAVAERLKAGETRIVDEAEATVLFADIAGFTSLTRQVSPEQLMEILNELFSTFDHLAADYGLEKIKTIGDSYMVAGGLPEPRPDHIEAVADMALSMQPAMRSLSHGFDHPLSLRIGIDTGPVIAGVIGRHKFNYDTWGDTVNTASRMASFGMPGAIQVTGRVVEQLHDRYQFQSRGKIEIKGSGLMQVYLLRGRMPEHANVDVNAAPTLVEKSTAFS